MIDWEAFHDMYQYFGSDLVAELIDLFVDGNKDENPPAPSYEERMIQLKRNVDENDYPELTWNACRIKGYIYNFYDAEPIDLARKLQDMGETETETGLTEEFEKFKIAADKLVIELREYRKTLTA
jgi:hypothetical protein